MFFQVLIYLAEGVPIVFYFKQNGILLPFYSQAITIALRRFIRVTGLPFQVVEISLV